MLIRIRQPFGPSTKSELCKFEHLTPLQLQLARPVGRVGHTNMHMSLCGSLHLKYRVTARVTARVSPKCWIASAFDASRGTGHQRIRMHGSIAKLT